MSRTSPSTGARRLFGRPRADGSGYPGAPSASSAYGVGDRDLPHLPCSVSSLATLLRRTSSVRQDGALKVGAKRRSNHESGGRRLWTELALVERRQVLRFGPE